MRRTKIRPTRNETGKNGLIALTAEGALTCFKGYCWDGPSGPTFDTAATMRASLFHDALYQLMRERKLHVKLHRRVADELLRNVMVEDGAWRWRD